MNSVARISTVRFQAWRLAGRLGAGLLLVLLPIQVLAHVRWFVEPEASTVTFQWNWLYAGILLGGLIYCLVCKSLQRVDSSIGETLMSYGGVATGRGYRLWQFLSSLVGLTLILNFLNGVLLAPNLQPQPMEDPISLMQLLTGVALVLNVSLRIGGLLIALFVLSILASHPFAIWIDYGFEFLGIALALLLYRNRELALFWLRCGLGLQLMVLAVHNKWMNPQLGLEFLQLHPWNFMAQLGWKDFSDLTFVFAAGTAEFCFGLVILMGWSTRLATAMVTSCFLLTAMVLGIHELIGHLPIIGVAVVLIVLGGGAFQSMSTKMRAPIIGARGLV